MRPIPDFKEPGLTGILSDLSRSLDALSRDAVLKRAAVPEIFLQSPGGRVYSLSVSDAGVLSATYVSG